MENKKKNGFFNDFFIKNSMDLPFFLLLLLVLAIGLVMLLSSSYFYAFYNTSGNDSLHYFKRQLFFAVTGIFIMYVVSKLDYKYLKLFGTLGMGVSLLLLVVVLLMPSDDGIKRWIDLGFFQFQPSEVAKFMLILFLANGLDKDYKKLVSSKLSKESFAHRLYEMSGNKILISQGTTTLFYYLFVVVIIAGLVALESHLSGTILILGIGVIMLWLGEGRAKWFAIGATIAVVAVIIVVKEYDNIPLLRDYMAERIQAWLDKDYEPTGARWQTNQSLYAIGSGGFFGSGLGNSKEKYLYVSEPQNDFIFAIVCEELGFVGAVAILLLYGALIVRGIIIGMHAKDRFGSLVAFGMVFQLGLQVALNVAVVTDTLPNTGIGLPFFSYGGSSMWLCLAEMGAILSVSRQANMPKIYTFKNIKAR
ncbi:MAG: FtsW/RodA/SpoVE family cell cycle protein [Clostridia bacterium]|nr:FtsW/RodA/SpoVE family cell cycle protein [Clostridia bacterium]